MTIECGTETVPESKPRKKYVRHPATPEEFAVTWTKAKSIEEVSQLLNMPLDVVSTRASFYRRRGVKLKKMPRRYGKQLAVKRLNVLVIQAEAEASGEMPSAK